MRRDKLLQQAGDADEPAPDLIREAVGKSRETSGGYQTRRQRDGRAPDTALREDLELLREISAAPYLCPARSISRCGLLLGVSPSSRERDRSPRRFAQAVRAAAGLELRRRASRVDGRVLERHAEDDHITMHPGTAQLGWASIAGRLEGPRCRVAVVQARHVKERDAKISVDLDIGPSIVR